FFKRLNKILELNYTKSLPKIGGDDIIVEIVESKFGKRKYNKGHHVEGVWNFGVVECSVSRNNLFFPI
ncbi:hypothetical protein H312_03084, partial [Anncaliia algerae PRA339]